MLGPVPRVGPVLSVPCVIMDPCFCPNGPSLIMMMLPVISNDPDVTLISMMMKLMSELMCYGP